VVERTAAITAAEADGEAPRFMNVRQVARYLQLNEKKVYALVNEGDIPATKVTGKWMFPRDLIDRWLIESSHGGVMTDRLALAGSDDPLLYRVVMELAQRVGSQAHISYSCTGTELGLSLLARQRADLCALHWGPASESQHRHTALLSQHPQHTDWILVRAFRREQGLMVRREHRGELTDLLQAPLRWALRQRGAGSQRFLQEALVQHRVPVAAIEARAVTTALSERDAAAHLAMDEADVAPGTRGSAREFGLGFVAVGWEAFDLALSRGVYFRKLFLQLLESLRSGTSVGLAQRLGGYDLSESGRVVWTR
jgi:putative molybdopterin biosynthesis protein